jgi:hypothetical protein
MITDTFIPMGLLSAKQNEYLFGNVIDAVKINIANSFSNIITVSADTGDGKTFTLINYILPELIRMGFYNHIYMAPDVGLVKQTREMAHDVMSMQLIAGKPVNIIDGETGKKYIKGTLKLPKNCINVFFITKKMFLDNKDVFIKGHLSANTHGAWSVFDDEAHSQTGVPSIRDTKPSTGVNNKKAKLSTFKALNAFRKSGNNIIGTSATLTNSQKGNTTDGRKIFLRLPQMPKDPLTCTFADFTPVSAVTNENWDFSKMLVTGLSLFAKHCKNIDALHDNITDATWNVLNTSNNSKFAYVRPDIIIKVGRSNATNGIKYEDCIDLINKFVTANKMILADLVEMTFNGKKVKDKDMGEMIKIINSIGLDKNIVIVTKDKANVGINVPTLTHAIIARTPSQKLIHNNWSQFLGRITRMPFFRSHQAAKDFIFGLDIHYDQKALLANYYALMNWSHSIVPEESELLASRVNADDEDDDEIDETVMDYRLKHTMNLEAGKQFLFDGLQESCTGKNGIGYTITRLTSEMANFIKGRFCGNCKRDDNGLPVCLPNVYETYNKTYGYVTLEEFLSNTDKSASVREHKDNNHFNNDSKNVAYVCATLSAFKTDIHKDWNQRYDKVNGKMIPSKINQIPV